MRLAITSALGMCLMGCLGGDNGGGMPGAAPDTVTTEINEELRDAPAAIFAPKTATALFQKAERQPFAAQLADAESEATEVHPTFDATRALAIQAFRARMGVEQ
jgi:hypothetical protein